jgi:hypothetical protein
MNFSNALTVRIKALDGLRPSFSSHVRWCEHGAPIEIAVVSGSHADSEARSLQKKIFGTLFGRGLIQGWEFAQLGHTAVA